MTTLAELIATDPSPSWGRAMPEISYGSGTWRIAFMVANPGAGASVTWHDLTGPVSQMEWSRGTSRPRGRFEAVTPTVLIHALDDTYAPWNPDTSGTFGTHVPLRAGLLMRASVFRVSGGSVDLCFHLFTAKVRRWRDQQAANGGYRFHRVDGVDLMSYLVQAPIGSQLQEGWKPRIDDLLTDADWPFGSDIYGAQTSDSTTTLLLPDRDAQDSAINEIDATLDPVGLTWRTTAAGKFLAHPLPWDTFHAGYFASTTETIVGSEWTSPIETYHPGGPTFSYIAADGEVQFITEPGGESFGIDSDLEKVANEWTITHPVDVTNLASGTTTSAYDDAVSAARYGRRAIPAASWIAENDTVMEDLVDASAYTDLSASPLSVDIRNENAFPAIAVLDHLDPCEIRHATRPGRTELTVSGPLRQIAHRIEVQGANTLWRAQIQVDIDTESTATPLNPVQNLAVSSPVPEDYAEFTWTNPSQTTTPTETQVRITNLSTQWLDLAYPGTGSAGFDWLALSPSTFYEFEVRLVRRVNDVITAVSPSRSVAFVTAKATVPTLNPGGGGTVTIPVDEYSCDTIEWKLEQSTDGGSSWTTVDSGDDADFDEDNVLDLSAFSYVSGYLYRVCSRCEGSGDPWDCSEVFQIECDAPGALSTSPFDDASLKIFVPKICDGEILEAVSGSAAVRGPAFGQIGTDSAGEYALMSDATASGIVAYGPADATIGLTGDASYGITVNLGDVPASGEPMAIWRCGGLHIEALYESATTWRVRAKIFIASGGSITTTSSSPLSLDTEYKIFVAHDVENEAVSVKVDGTEVATGVAGTRINALAVWMITLPADSYATSAAVWSSVLNSVPGEPAYVGEVMADNPLYYFRLNDAGPAAVDRAGNYTGELFGGVYFDAADVPFAGAGGMLCGGGSNDYIGVTDADAALGGQLGSTYEAWVKHSGDEAILFDARGAAGGHLCMVNTSGAIQVTFYATAGGRTSTTGVVPTNTWTHVAVTITAGGLYTFYVNGSAVSGGGTNAVAPSPGYDPTLFMARGGSGGSGFANFATGRIAENAYYGTALSAARIAAHYAAASS